MKIIREIAPLLYNPDIGKTNVSLPFLVGYYTAEELSSEKTETSLLLDSIVNPILDELKKNNIGLANEVAKAKILSFACNWQQIDSEIDVAFSTFLNYLARKCFSDKLNPQIIYDFEPFKHTLLGYPIRAASHLLLTKNKKEAIRCAPLELRKIVYEYVGLSDQGLAKELVN